MTLVVYSTVMPVSAAELFEFHMDTANLAAISPPFPPMRLAANPGPTEAGDLQVMSFGWPPVAVDWHARVLRVVPGKLLEDVQERGPFRRWRHQHRVADQGGAARLTDAVSFRLLPTPVGEFLEFFLVRPAVLAMFAYRHRKTRQLLADRRRNAQS